MESVQLFTISDRGPLGTVFMNTAHWENSGIRRYTWTF